MVKTMDPLKLPREDVSEMFEDREEFAREIVEYYTKKFKDSDFEINEEQKDNLQETLVDSIIDEDIWDQVWIVTSSIAWSPSLSSPITRTVYDDCFCILLELIRIPCS